ncbi:MAG: hypothetical protein KKG10_02275 [Proteobacteria bacterium]|nr:hypothetical protein [Pseudomonadota bacterium]
MAIFLVQHGKSLSKDQDPEQGLSRQGIDDVERIAAVAQGYGVQVQSMWVTGRWSGGRPSASK